EEFAMRRADSRFAAEAWLWWQALRCLAAPPVDRARLSSGRSRGESAARTVIADARYALRVIARAPSFAVAVVAVLAIGIGANAALFSVVNTVLLRPLPFEDPDRLVRIFTRTSAGDPFDVSPGKFYDWQRDARSFEGMAI